MVLDLLNVRAWAMESRFFERAYPVAFNLINNGQDLSKLKELTKEAAIFPEAYERDRNSRMLLFQAGNGKKIGLLRITGGLTKMGDLCSYGTMDYIRMIERANKSDAIDAIVIELDSPGGSVDGTPELGLAIKESEKPVVVFADNMVASAGYWAASQAREIVANANNYTEIGSIGTLFVYPNYANVIEAGNFPNVKIIRAPQSKDKARINMFEPLTEAQEKEITADLKQITSDFISTVEAGRGDRLQTGEEDIFTGKMYGSDKALEMGMIDSIGDRQSAIDRAGELAEERKLTVPAASGTTNKLSMDFKKISSLFGKAGTEVKEGLSVEEQASLEAAEQKLTEYETKITELEAQVNTLAEEKSGLEASIATHEATIEAHEATIAEQKVELDKKPDGQATTVIPKKDEFEDGKNSIETSVDKEVAEMRKLTETPKEVEE